MNHPGDILGLQWFPMQALYSSIGNKNNSHETICELGKELQSLAGKHGAVMQGINNKLDDPLREKALNRSDANTKNLKQRIVAKIGEHVSKAGTQPSGPVVSNAGNVVFDEKAKEVLAEVVKNEVKGSLTQAQVREAFSELIEQKELAKKQHIEAISTYLDNTDCEGIHAKLLNLSQLIEENMGQPARHGPQPISDDDEE